MNDGRRLLLTVCSLSLFLLTPLYAQEEPLPQEESPSVRLYLDCNAPGCYDGDYLRREIPFVNWVRDQRDADVFLLVTSQGTGAGGRSFQLFFIGQDRFEEMSDTLSYISGFDATEDELREGLGGIIKIGLMRYVGLTSQASNILIRVRPPGGGQGPGGPGGPRGDIARPEDDPWNFWVFRARVNGFMNGESTNGFMNLSGSFTASRTTEEWKTSLSLRTSYNESSFEYEADDEVYSSLTVRRSHSASGLLVKSMGDHWSSGLRGGLSNSTYTNLRLGANLAPVLEYNVYPYAESDRKSLTLQYAVELAYFDYVEETVYFKEHETLLSHDIVASLDFTQPWGSANVYGGAGHFLRDIEQHHLDLGGHVNVRLARGFSVNFGGSVSRIQDRISVPLDPATVEDVLLQRKQLQTDYYYYLNFGFSYTFGSIFNNVVNPRIGGSSGGMMIMM